MLEVYYLLRVGGVYMGDSTPLVGVMITAMIEGKEGTEEFWVKFKA